MNEFLALCGAAICNELNCDTCHQIFETIDCPIDNVFSRHDLIGYVQRLLAAMKDESKLWTEEEIINLLKGE